MGLSEDMVRRCNGVLEMLGRSRLLVARIGLRILVIIVEYWS